MIKIIDYKAGNAPSVWHAVTHLGYEAALVRSPEELVDATHIILPGVGSAGATMDSLRETGFISAMEEAVFQRKTLFLGICVGLQVLFEHSEEDDADCLGWLKGRVVKFDASKVKVPQMGWNQLRQVPHGGAVHPVWEGIPDNSYFYFVHSFYARPQSAAHCAGEANYGGVFAAAIARDNIFAAQFHPEKSAEHGLALYRNFLHWNP